MKKAKLGLWEGPSHPPPPTVSFANFK